MILYPFPARLSGTPGHHRRPLEILNDFVSFPGPSFGDSRPPPETPGNTALLNGRFSGQTQKSPQSVPSGDCGGTCFCHENKSGRNPDTVMSGLRPRCYACRPFPLVFGLQERTYAITPGLSGPGDDHTVFYRAWNRSLPIP